MEKENLGVEATSTLFNKHSGMLGLSGISSDFRDINKAATAGDELSQLAIKMFCYRVKKYIGAYTAAMNGCDILIFTGGVGENSDFTRKGICEDLDWMGFEMDEIRNLGLFGIEAVISSEKSKVKILVVPTDEELMIAKDTLEFLK